MTSRYVRNTACSARWWGFTRMGCSVCVRVCMCVRVCVSVHVCVRAVGILQTHVEHGVQCALVGFRTHGLQRVCNCVCNCVCLSVLKCA